MQLGHICLDQITLSVPAVKSVTVLCSSQVGLYICARMCGPVSSETPLPLPNAFNCALVTDLAKNRKKKHDHQMVILKSNSSTLQKNEKQIRKNAERIKIDQSSDSPNHTEPAVKGNELVFYTETQLLEVIPQTPKRVIFFLKDAH